MSTQPKNTENYDANEGDIAIIGMVGRFPDADNIEDFWTNLKNGLESVKPLSHDIISQGSLNDFLENNEEFIYAEASLDKEMVKMFDAEFFNISPREAEIMDPQHRMFLEACWELFESSGYSMEHYDGKVGVFGSAAYSGYFENFSDQLLREVGVFQTQLANDKDFLSTRVSYKMGFTGPSVNVNTLCSSAAVGIHLARESLLNFQSDFVMAGGVNISFTTAGTSYYHEGGIGADEGHCRAYDENASGTVAGNGLGIIAMKRLEDALAGGDNILAVIKGTAVNNDGANKASYTAPSPDGQAEVIAECLAISDVNPETISYIDGHGTGTYIGDPIEITGLTKAYRQYTNKKQYCAIGSVKTNIGHLVTAGGVASLIKTVMSLKNKKIPPSLNFEKPNPKIDFENSPFFVNDKLRDWESAQHPRRAAVSSFGIGGTNVHTILEEAPAVSASTKSDRPQLILLSARSQRALADMKVNLNNYLEKNPDVNLADVSYTLKIGRCGFEHRYSTVCGSVSELREILAGKGDVVGISNQQKKIDRSVCFMFSGQGSQYQNMGKQLYLREPVFKSAIDECAGYIQDRENIDIRDLMYPKNLVQPCPLEDTLNAQLTLFTTEYAIYKLWESWGVLAESFIGHSIGEYVAACVSGVFTLPDALTIVAARGRLMSKQPSGDMISVFLSEEEAKPYLNSDVCVAAVNGVRAVVLSGTKDAIALVFKQLIKDKVEVSYLKTSHAFHSKMMEPAREAFVETFLNIELQEPKTPFISNVTGDWITAEQATDPKYWAQHLCSKVLFLQGIKTLVKDESLVLLEVGPSSTLATLAGMTNHDKRLVIASLPKRSSTQDNTQIMNNALAGLWSVGVTPSWDRVYQNEFRRRIPLPTYPFERKPYWISQEFVPFNNKYRTDVELNELSGLDEVLSKDEAFTEGSIHIDLKFPELISQSNSNKLAAVLALRKRFEEISEELGSDIVITVSPVGLVKEVSAENSGEKISDEGLPTIKNANSRPQVNTTVVEPRTDLERELVDNWEKALGFSPVGIYDNFFELGGHSLIASKLANSISQEHKVTVGLREFLEKPTVANLAELIEAKHWILNKDEDSDDQSDGETLIL